MTRLRLRTSGGIANLRLEGELDYSELTSEQLRRVEQLLQAGGQRRSGSATADAIDYELWAIDEAAGRTRHVVVSDADADADAMAVLDELTTLVIDKKRQK